MYRVQVVTCLNLWHLCNSLVPSSFQLVSAMQPIQEANRPVVQIELFMVQVMHLGLVVKEVDRKSVV